VRRLSSEDAQLVELRLRDSVELCLAPATAPATAPAEVELKDKAGKVLPPYEKLAEVRGDAKKGAAVYRNPQGVNCIRCHQIGDEGGEIGPPLTTIGEKLSRAQLLESILYPSNAILMGFENWLVKTKDGEIHEGLLASETPELLTLKTVEGKYDDIKVENIEKKIQQNISIMPDGLQTALTQQELTDLLEYLTTLKNP
jgi:putative heme-binding domain-containing protein